MTAMNDGLEESDWVRIGEEGPRGQIVYLDNEQVHVSQFNDRMDPWRVPRSVVSEVPHPAIAHAAQEILPILCSYDRSWNVNPTEKTREKIVMQVLREFVVDINDVPKQESWYR